MAERTSSDLISAGVEDLLAVDMFACTRVVEGEEREGRFVPGLTSLVSLDRLRTMDYSTEIQQLESLLPLIRSTRSSLPSVVSSLSPSTRSPHLDLATLYRLASTQCETSVRTLGERLQAIEATLDQAEQSYERDSNGVVLRETTDKDPWERVGEILGATRGGGSNDSKPFQARLEAPKTTEELDQFLKTWQTNHPRVRFDSQARQRGGDTERIEMRLKGVMRASIVVRWAEGQGSNCASVELIACSSLKENVSRLLQALSQSCTLLTNIKRPRAESAVSTKSFLTLPRIDKLCYELDRQVSFSTRGQNLKPRRNTRTHAPFHIPSP